MGDMQYGSLGRLIAMPLLLVASACTRPASEPSAQGSWTYEVDAPAAGSREVGVEVVFDRSRTERIAIAHESAAFVRGVEVKTSSGWAAVEQRGTQWYEPSCTTHCTIRYRIDLGEVARACKDEVDCARRVGDATLSPALAWLAHPSPKTDVPVTVHVRTPNPQDFATGMHATDSAAQTYAFRSYDLDEGSFTAFGPQRHVAVDVPSLNGQSPSRVDVVLVGKGRFAMTDEQIGQWVRDAGGVVAPLFGRFPVDHTTLFVVPARGQDEVVFGKVLSLAGASVVLVVGDRMKEAAQHQDWVLVHEMFHLGFPTFRGEGRWLGEGLATYYEPILRARAGWTGEPDVYRQFVRNMPRGMPARGSASSGLAQREDLDSIYWGGALFCLAADVRIREETRGRHSLDDVLRAALLRGGDATKVWTVAEVVRLADDVTGTKVMSEMYDRYAARGERIDIEALFAQLGVGRDGAVTEQSPRHPLAWVRRQIVGMPNPQVAVKVPAIR